MKRGVVVWGGCGLLLACLTALPTAAGASAESVGDDGVGLGSYGRQGVITRDLLPEGTRDLVSDEAIAAAYDPVFAAARLAWDREADFVDQIDYQLVFRSYVDYMSLDPAHIAGLLLAKPENAGAVSMRLFMSADEVDEMARRDELGDRMGAVVTLVTGVDEAMVPEGVLPDYGPNFGGIWMDQLDGGRIVLAVVDASTIPLDEIEAIVGDGDLLWVVEQPFTYNEVEEFRGQLESELDTLGVERDIAAVHGEGGRLLEVRVVDPAALPESFGSGLPEGAFTVVEGPPVVEASFPGSTHSWTNQQPGLEIHVSDGFPCTWGFNGHTTAWNFLITAGHCMPEGYENFAGGWLGSTADVYQNNDPARNLTLGSTYLYSVDTSTYDVARLSTAWADDNCYHGNNTLPDPHCRWPIASRALHNSWEVGVGEDQTCASLGASNTYRCGYILEVNHLGGNRVRVGMTGIGGDSGSGMKWENRADGILTDILDTYPDPSPEVFFQTAYHAQQGGGFQLNCHASGKKVYPDPADWGDCPTSDA